MLLAVGQVCSTLAQSAKWRSKNRLQTTFEFDDNIRESLSDSLDALSATSLKLLFNTRISRLTPRTSFRINYQGGLQSYFDHSIENKLINEASAAGTIRLGRFRLGGKAQGRLKIYLNDVLDYASGSLEVTLGLPPVGKFSHQAAVRLSGIDYANFQSFNYGTVALSWTLVRKVTRHVAWNLTLSHTRISYDRGILQSAGTGQLRFLSRKQSDRNLAFRSGISYTKSFLFNLTYAVNDNNSNSLGFSYVRHQIVLLLGLPLQPGFWLRGYAATQFKSYREKELSMFPTDVDTERDESTFFILDLSKDLKPNLTLLTRLAHYNNESVIRNRFYRKTVVSAGFDYRF